MDEDLLDRIAAVRAWYGTAPMPQANPTDTHAQRMRLAVQAFKGLRPRSQIAQPAHFIDYHVRKFEEHGSVCTSPHPGRPPIIKDTKLLQTCADQLKAGYTFCYHGEELLRHFMSIEEAVDTIPLLQETVQQHHVTPQHLLKRMHAVDPGLAWKEVQFRKRLKAQDKQLRRRTARELLRDMTHDALMDTVFVDAKKCWVSLEGTHVWMDVHDNPEMTDPRVPNEGNAYPMCWYVAVNAQVGLVWFDFVTGTGKPFTRLDPFMEEAVPEEDRTHGKTTRRLRGFWVSTYQPASSSVTCQFSCCAFQTRYAESQ